MVVVTKKTRIIKEKADKYSYSNGRTPKAQDLDFVKIIALKLISANSLFILVFDLFSFSPCSIKMPFLRTPPLACSTKFAKKKLPSYSLTPSCLLKI